MNRLLTATAVMIALVPLAALAGEGKSPDPAATPAAPAGQSSFDTLDANKDGRISMPEASADPKLVESFSTADKNGDGYLDASEYAAAVRNSNRTNTEPQPQ